MPHYGLQEVGFPVPCIGHSAVELQQTHTGPLSNTTESLNSCLGVNDHDIRIHLVTARVHPPLRCNYHCATYAHVSFASQECEKRNFFQVYNSFLSKRWKLLCFYNQGVGPRSFQIAGREESVQTNSKRQKLSEISAQDINKGHNKDFNAADESQKDEAAV